MDGWIDGWIGIGIGIGIGNRNRKTLFIHGDFDHKITKLCTFVLHKSRAINYNLRFKIYIQLYINV